MSKPFSTMFARRYSKRQVTNRDFNFVRDWNADSSDGRTSDNHDTFSAKVTPRAQYIISSSKPSPAHGNHIPELSDLISSSPIPVVIQSPPARAIPYQQAAFGEEDDEEEEVANEEDEEEEMAEEEESGRDGDASMADSTMAVKDDGESESNSFVVEATIRHAQEEDMNSASHNFRKETVQRSMDNDQEDSMNESEQSNRDIEADSENFIDRPLSQNDRNDGSQRNRSEIQTNMSSGRHINTVLQNQTTERDDGEENEKPLHKKRQSVNNRENVRNSVSKLPKQTQNFNKSRSSDPEQQNKTFERRKTHSGKKERLTRHSSMEQDVSDGDTPEMHDSDLEEEEIAGKRRQPLSESRTQAPPEGTTDEAEIMEEIGHEDMEEDVTQDQMLQDETSQGEETAASIMIQSTIQDTPITAKSPKKLKRSLVNNINNDHEKEDDNDANVDRPAVTVPPPLKQKKISFSSLSDKKKSEEKKRKEPVHHFGLWQGDMDKRNKKSVLDLDIVLNDLDEKLQVASDRVHLTTIKKKECQLLSHIKKRIISTIEAVEETRQKRMEIIRTKRNVKDSRSELLDLQQKNIRLSEKLGNEKSTKEYRKELLNNWITSFETLMVASRNIKTKSSMKGMVSFGYLPKIQ